MEDKWAPLTARGIPYCTEKLGMQPDNFTMQFEDPVNLVGASYIVHFPQAKVGFYESGADKYTVMDVTGKWETPVDLPANPPKKLTDAVVKPPFDDGKTSPQGSK